MRTTKKRDDACGDLSAGNGSDEGEPWRPGGVPSAAAALGCRGTRGLRTGFSPCVAKRRVERNVSGRPEGQRRVSERRTDHAVIDKAVFRGAHKINGEIFPRERPRIEDLCLQSEMAFHTPEKRRFR